MNFFSSRFNPFAVPVRCSNLRLLRSFAVVKVAASCRRKVIVDRAVSLPIQPLLGISFLRPFGRLNISADGTNPLSLSLLNLLHYSLCAWISYFFSLPGVGQVSLIPCEFERMQVQIPTYLGLLQAQARFPSWSAS